MSQKKLVYESQENATTMNSRLRLGHADLGLYKWGGISKDRVNAPMPTPAPAGLALHFAIFLTALLVVR
jgi:hypothetical protein